MTLPTSARLSLEEIRAIKAGAASFGNKKIVTLCDMAIASLTAEREVLEQKERANAWFLVAHTLDELRPGWQSNGNTGQETAVNTILAFIQSGESGDAKARSDPHPQRPSPGNGGETFQATASNEAPARERCQDEGQQNVEARGSESLRIQSRDTSAHESVADSPAASTPLNAAPPVADWYGRLNSVLRDFTDHCCIQGSDGDRKVVDNVLWEMVRYAAKQEFGAAPDSAEFAGTWIGCGECDPKFQCFNGECRCIRMPLKTDSAEGLLWEAMQIYGIRDVLEYFAKVSTPGAILLKRIDAHLRREPRGAE